MYPLRHPHVVVAVTSIVTLLTLPASAMAARNPVAKCQRTLEDAGTRLLTKVLRAQHDCLRRREAGKIASDARCLVDDGSPDVITDTPTRDAMLLATGTFRSAVARRCEQVDLLVPRRSRRSANARTTRSVRSRVTRAYGHRARVTSTMAWSEAA
jgi:hypothetical protein